MLTIVFSALIRKTVTSNVALKQKHKAKVVATKLSEARFRNYCDTVGGKFNSKVKKQK